MEVYKHALIIVDSRIDNSGTAVMERYVVLNYFCNNIYQIDDARYRGTREERIDL